MASMANAIEALRKFDSATVANAIERTGLAEPTEGFGSLELRCQFPDLPPMVGISVTCTHDSTSRDPGPSQLHDLIDMVEATVVQGLLWSSVSMWVRSGTEAASSGTCLPVCCNGSVASGS